MAHNDCFILPEQLLRSGIHIDVIVAHPRPRLPARWLKRIAATVLAGEEIVDSTITLVLCDDRTIRKLNKQYLHHNWSTDVLSFPLSQNPWQGEIYISVDSAVRQACEYGVSIRQELGRLAIHGVLHLLGYDDATTSQRQKMHSLEDYYLNIVRHSTTRALK